MKPFRRWIALNWKTKILFTIAAIIDIALMIYLNYMVRNSDNPKSFFYVIAICVLACISVLFGPGLFAASLMGAVIGIYIWG